MNNIDLRTNLNSIELCVAEVLEVQPYNTYKHVPATKENDSKNTSTTNTLFSVRAKIDGIINKPIIDVKPLSNGIKKIPVVGELILVFKLNSSHQSIQNQEQWFYISTVDLNSSINHNALPGYTSGVSTNSTNIGKTIAEKVISPLQPYEGDSLIEGRWGNSIRFGSTIKTAANVYTINPDTWQGDSFGDPITIISNGRKNKPGKEFVVESPETCASSIYLTTTQRIPKLKLNNQLTIGDSVSAFAGSQLIGFADRIVFKAKSDIIVLDSKKGIEINSPLIKMGVKSNENKEPFLHSTAVDKLIGALIRVVSIGFKDSNGTICTPIDDSLSKPDILQARLQLLNYNILTDKHNDAK